MTIKKLATGETKTKTLRRVIAQMDPILTTNLNGIILFWHNDLNWTTDMAFYWKGLMNIC